MKLGLAHELGLCAALTMSIAIVLLGGSLPPFAWLLCLAPALSMAMALKGISAPPLSATLVGIASIVLGAATIVRGGLESSVLGGAEVLMGLLAARLLVRKGPSHDLQAITISLLLVLTGSALNVTITYMVVFVPYAIAVVWALCTRQLLSGAGEESMAATRARTDIVTPAFFAATAAISLVVLSSAGVIFAAFPRVGFGDIGAFLMKESTLPTAVGLRGDPRAGGGSDAVARVRRLPRAVFDEGLYLRGAVYDRITLNGFSQTPVAEQPPPGPRRGTAVELAAAPLDARYEMTLMPVVGDTLLTLGGTVAMRTVGGGSANPNLTLGIAGRSGVDEVKAVSPLLSPLKYDVAGGVARAGFVPDAVKRPPTPLQPDVKAHLLQLPPDFDQELRALTKGVVGERSTPQTKAIALRNFLLQKFVYSQQPPRFADQPLKTFLLKDRQGHCEFFASAFALMLRSEGIPSRVIGGFQGGAWDDDVVVFQTRHAHAWVEWWHDDYGWIVDDATPLATMAGEELTGMASMLERARRFWDDRILDYSMQDQTDALAEARRAWRNVGMEMGPIVRNVVVAIAVPLVLGGLAWGVIWLRRRRRAEVAMHPLAQALVDVIGKQAGFPVPSGHTLREAVDATMTPPPLAQALRDALAAYEGHRFGAAPLTHVDSERLAKSLRTIARAHEPRPGARSR